MEPVLEMFGFKRDNSDVLYESLGVVPGTICTFIPVETMRAMLMVATMPGNKVNLEPLKSMKIGVDIVVHNHSFGKAEVHMDWDDVWEVIDGRMTFILGGQLDQATLQQKEPGELRADGIIGGREVVLGPGDQLIIPAGEPHQNMCTHGIAKARIVKRLRKSILDELVQCKQENEALRRQIN